MGEPLKVLSLLDVGGEGTSGMDHPRGFKGTRVVVYPRLLYPRRTQHRPLSPVRPLLRHPRHPRLYPVLVPTRGHDLLGQVPTVPRRL